MFLGVDLGFALAHFYCIVTEFNPLDGRGKTSCFHF